MHILAEQNPAVSLQVMEVDINGDGTIDFQEFLGMMKSKANEADQESDLREAFKIFDRDKDGYIDMKELKKVIIIINVEKDERIVKVACMLGAMLTKDEVDEFMREADMVCICLFQCHCLCLCIHLFVVRSFLLITLIKCLKGSLSNSPTTNGLSLMFQNRKTLLDS